MLPTNRISSLSPLPDLMKVCLPDAASKAGQVGDFGAGRKSVPSS